MRKLEICVEDPAGLNAAVAGGADRIELCSALAVGGLTPSPAMLDAAAALPILVHVLIRPRDGDFRYGAAEAALVAADIRAVAERGLAGIVIGASGADDRLDTAMLADWIDVARAAGANRDAPLSLTLHRAFDLCPDLPEALEQAVTLGFDRVLTSAGAPRVGDALDTLETLVRQAGSRVIVLAGSGVDAAVLPAILATGVREVHASCRSPGDAPGPREQAFGFQAGPRLIADARKIADLRAILDAA